MNALNMLHTPAVYPCLLEQSEARGFTMPSDSKVGSMLRTLVASKPNGIFLELGTGMGLSLAWMLDGMDSNSKMISLDSDMELVDLAKQNFFGENRLELLCVDGEGWLSGYKGPNFDLIFADAWPGKYSLLDSTLNLLNVGGFYVIDDMVEQPNWPEGHGEKAKTLIGDLESKRGLKITNMDWSTGVIIAVKVDEYGK